MENGPTHKVPRYPDFIGIGAQKSGTSWAHEQLKAHPQVFVPETEELNFFYTDRPDSWYAAQFQNASETEVLGEVSPNYFVRAEVPQRMHKLIPNAKLFCILRNPTDRAFSQWKMARKLGNIPMDLCFIDAFRWNRRWMSEQGNYLKLIQQFEMYYPVGERLLVLFIDDVRAEPGEVVRALYKFLGIDPAFCPPSVSDVVGGATDLSNISEKDRNEVQEFYSQDIIRLADRFDRNLSHWTTD
jgi:hypothetical protein